MSLDPVRNDLSEPFWSDMGEGSLNLPFCEASGRHFWPPSPVSPFVNEGQATWRAALAEGRLVSLVVFRRSFHPDLAGLIPYGVGLVELDAGPRLRAFVRDPMRHQPVRHGERVRIGLRPIDGHGPAVPTVVPVD